tara:strand:- start:5570 stop:5806 length:237 start_codon:yes stop_codon:yes gene_type:complete
MKTVLSILSLSLSISFLISCASSPEELQYKMDKKANKFDDRQEMWAIRSEAFDNRLNQMGRNADDRYQKSYAKVMGGD